MFCSYFTRAYSLLSSANIRTRSYNIIAIVSRFHSPFPSRCFIFVSSIDRSFLPFFLVQEECVCVCSIAQALACCDLKSYSLQHIVFSYYTYNMYSYIARYIHIACIIPLVQPSTMVIKYTNERILSISYIHICIFIYE